MKVQVLRKMKYAGTFIYVFQFEYVFMYLFHFNGEIYQNHFSLIPNLSARFLWKLRMVDSPFVSEQLEEGEKIILSGAMKSLDELNDPKAKIKQDESNKLAKHEKELNKCTWQAREGKDDKYYFCLTHKTAVRMQDGVLPRHE